MIRIFFTLSLSIATAAGVGCSSSDVAGSGADASIDTEVVDAPSGSDTLVPRSDGSSEIPPADASEASADARADAPFDASAEGSSEACSRPTDCSPGTPFCCANWRTGTGTFPDCPVDLGTYSVGCSATCATSSPTTCDAKNTARLCEAKSDCVETGYTECCIFGSDAGSSPAMCVSPYAKPYAQSCAQ